MTMVDAKWTPNRASLAEPVEGNRKDRAFFAPVPERSRVARTLERCPCQDGGDWAISFTTRLAPTVQQNICIVIASRFATAVPKYPAPATPTGFYSFDVMFNVQFRRQSDFGIAIQSRKCFRPHLHPVNCIRCWFPQYMRPSFGVMQNYSLLQWFQVPWSALEVFFCIWKDDPAVRDEEVRSYIIQFGWNCFDRHSIPVKCLSRSRLTP